MRARETTLGPAIRIAVNVEESIFLLKTEPGHFILGLLKDLGGVVAEVGLVGGAVVVVGLAENKDVITATEGVLEDGSRSKVDVRIVTRGLVGGGAVKVPDTELANVGDLLADGLGE